MISLLKSPLSHLANQWPRLFTNEAASPSQPSDEPSECPLQPLSLFTDLPAQQQQIIFDQMQLETYDAGEVIYGADDESSTMYLIRDGWVRLYSPDDQPVGNALGPGNLLGENDFFLKRSRPNAAHAVNPVAAWTLTDRALTNVVTSYPDIGLNLGLALGRGIAHFHTYLAYRLRQAALIETLSDTQRAILAGYLSPHQFLPRDTIYRSGAPATGLFIIERGAVWLLSDTDENHQELGPGDAFGEWSVLYQKPHAYTAQAAANTIVWLLSPADFTALNSAHPSITATLGHHLHTTLIDALTMASAIVNQEINAMHIVCGNHHPHTRDLHDVQRTLSRIKNYHLSI